MSRFHLCRSRTLAAVAALVIVLLPAPAQALAQRDWMVALVDSLGRSFGLPDTPQVADYLAVLQGQRTLRLEAETVHAQDDEVSSMALPNYGTFSGPGWVVGTNRPCQVHLRFTLPLDGRYRLSLAVRSPGHVVVAGGRSFTIDGEAQRFARAEVGEVTLTAGPQEIVVTLPPGGALDYVELAAPGLSPVAPDGGWQPDSPLTWEVLAVTAVQALDLGKDLPPTDQALTVEAETLTGIGMARVVEDTHLGRSSGGRWLRTSAQPAEIAVPLAIAAGGFYDLELAIVGQPVRIKVNAHQELSVDGKPYLDSVTIPPVFLGKGANALQVTLPPGGGLDRITLKARRSDLTALAAALGMAVTGTAPATADLDRLTARLAATAR